MDVSSAIRTRRSHKLFTGKQVEPEVLQELIELATWAPNHRYTEPWRFSVVSGAKLAALADAVALGLGEEPAARKQAEKIRGILSGAAAAIGVRQLRSPGDPERDREDYAACCCAMQNIQLGAWERGYGSYWTTSPAIIGEAMAEFWKVGAGELLIGAIVLGEAAVAMPALRHKNPQDLTDWL
jgi:nitroreductase